jgi:hypothetical protein
MFRQIKTTIKTKKTSEVNSGLNFYIKSLFYEWLKVVVIYYDYVFWVGSVRWSMNMQGTCRLDCNVTYLDSTFC